MSTETIINYLSSFQQAPGPPEGTTLKLDTMGIIGLCLLAVVMFMATLGGVGGTSAIFPITLVFFNFSISSAVSHTSLYAFVSTIGRVIYELLSTYGAPEKKRINFHLVILAAPVMFFGSFLGVNFNEISPRLLILIGMTLVLSLGVIMSIKKFFKKRAQEKEQDKVNSSQVSDDNETMDMDQTIDSDLYQSMVDPEPDFDKDSPIEVKAEVNQPRIQQKVNCLDMLMLIVISAINPLLAFFRGTKTVKSIIGNKACSQTDMIIVGAYLFLVVLLTIINSIRMVKRSKELVNTDKQIKFTPSKIFTTLIGVFLVATVGSFLGAGVTVLFSLFLIFYGFSPFVASPTALVLTCMTSASSAFLYLLDDKINPLAGLLGGGIILVFSIGTRVTIYNKLMKNGKESVIMLFIIILVGLAIPTNVFKVLPSILKDKDDGKPIFAFKSICHH